jgi:hypothetical protein
LAVVDRLEVASLTSLSLSPRTKPKMAALISLIRLNSEITSSAISRSIMKTEQIKIDFANLFLCSLPFRRRSLEKSSRWKKARKLRFSLAKHREFGYSNRREKKKKQIN